MFTMHPPPPIKKTLVAQLYWSTVVALKLNNGRIFWRFEKKKNCELICYDRCQVKGLYVEYSTKREQRIKTKLEV